MKLAAPETALSARSIAAAICGLVGGIVFRAGIHGSEGSIWIPVVALVVAGVVVFVPHLGAQLLARALFWSNLVLGSILCVVGDGYEKTSGIGLAIACGLALLLADRRALAAAAEARDFRPAAFAGTIELVAILALADAQTLFLFSAISLRKSDSPSLLFFFAAVAFVVGFVGVYRLALWGVVVTMSTAALLAVALVSDVVHGQRDMVTVVVVLCTAQILAPSPMLISILTKRRLPTASPRTRSALASGFVLLVVILSIAYALAH